MTESSNSILWESEVMLQASDSSTVMVLCISCQSFSLDSGASLHAL